MARRFDQYRVTEESDASAEYFNEVHEDLDLRLHSVEQLASGWSEAIQEFTELGMQKLDQALTPLYEQVAGVSGSIAELIQVGTYFNATSLSSATPSSGQKTFVIQGEQVREHFSPAYYMTALKSDDPETFMSGYLVSYNRSTGVLIIDVDHYHGSTAIAEWTLVPSVEPALLQDAYAARDAAIVAQGQALSYATQAASTQAVVSSMAAAATGAKDQALLSANNAFSYANQALAARDAAIIQKNGAETAATNANTAYASIQYLMESLRNIHLGEYPDDPVAGYNGAPLAPGMMYNNTTVYETRIYTGEEWIPLTSNQFLTLEGGALTGPLLLHGDPTQDLQASTKSFTEQQALMMALALG